MGKFLTEEEKSSQPKVTPALLKRIFSYLMPYKLQLALVLGCIVVSSFFTLLPCIAGVAFIALVAFFSPRSL